VSPPAEPDEHAGGLELVWGPPGGVTSPSLERAPIHTVEALDERLDRLDATGRGAEPFIVELIDPERGTLAIGVGRDWSVATFERADGEPPYLISQGDAGVAPEPLVFFYGGTWSEFPPEAAIPAAVAREALRSFLRRRERPDNLRWAET
jgi:Immunity protein Imm1